MASSALAFGNGCLITVAVEAHPEAKLKSPIESTIDLAKPPLRKVLCFTEAPISHGISVHAHQGGAAKLWLATTAADRDGG